MFILKAFEGSLPETTKQAKLVFKVEGLKLETMKFITKY